MNNRAFALLVALFVFVAKLSAGVTIHFEGTASSDAAVLKIFQIARDFAATHKWTAEDASSEAGSLKRVIDEKSCDYHGRIRGVVLRISDDCEPLFLRFGDDLMMQDFVKTQFAGANTHIQIVELLESIRPFLSRIDVFDEGDYWDTHDRKVLEDHIATVDRMIEALKKEHPNAQGPVKFGEGRIADIVH